ncbi:hypothetical protein LguiB_008374 [Lonicera macranthoides]
MSEMGRRVVHLPAEERERARRRRRGREPALVGLWSQVASELRKIKAIEASFEACKSRPAHATNKKLEPIEILPLLPDIGRYGANSFYLLHLGPSNVTDIYSKLDKTVRDAHESHAIMKSFVSTTSDPVNPDKFLAYMVPARHELSKDIYDEHEETSFTWIHEYHWDSVRSEDADDPLWHLVNRRNAIWMQPLPTKLALRKKRAKDGKTSDEVEHFPIPTRVTVRRRATVSAAAELKKPGSIVIQVEGGMGVSQILEMEASAEGCSRHRRG